MNERLIDTQGKPLSSVDLAVIGGSGLYQIDSLREVTAVEIDTPFGPPSDLITVGRLGGLRVAFLPRHARGHKWLPSEINYRANIWALKRLGTRFILSVSAVGSLQEEVEPGHLVCPDQFIDRTYKRDNTFFGEGIVGHISFGDPVDPKLSNLVFDAATEVTTTKVHRGGTYVCIEGPTFSTRAESLLFKAAGARIVGMTNLPEARLAREAEIAYATLALSTDYDCWHADHDEVSVASVLEVMKANIAQARGVIVAFAAKLEAHLDDDFMAHSALGGGTAIMTNKSLIPNETLDKVALLFGAYLKS
jgi:5'-methylthioadenosine phosphorylase